MLANMVQGVPEAPVTSVLEVVDCFLHRDHISMAGFVSGASCVVLGKPPTFPGHPKSAGNGSSLRHQRERFRGTFSSSRKDWPEYYHIISRSKRMRIRAIFVPLCELDVDWSGQESPEE